MDSIVHTALEEICCEGTKGISLVTLSSRLSPLSSSVKVHLWKNLLPIPQLQFKSKKNTVYGPSDPSIQNLEDALRLDLRIVANDKLRSDFFGLYEDSALPAIPRRVLELLAAARGNGVLQNVLAKEFGMKGSKFFYYIELLRSRGLIVKQPAMVKTKEGASSISTNVIYLTRYAKHLGSQQRFEIRKQDFIPETPMKENEAREGLQSETKKDYTMIKDFLPAMQAVCDKLEGAKDKVLVVSDIRQDLGYLGSLSRRRAWKSVCRRLTDCHLVEEFDAMVNDKVERCLRLLKRFSAKDFCYRKEQLLKFGRSIQKTEQTLELPIDNQMYDMIDAEGSKGLAVVEVCERLGIDKKKAYPRLCSICLRAGMHIQTEVHKKTTSFRVWTSRPTRCEPSSHPDKSENLSKENNVPVNDFGTSYDTDGLDQISTEHSLADFATPGRVTDSETNSGVLDCSQVNAKRRKLLPRRNLQETFHEIADKVIDAAMGSPDLDLPEMNHLVTPELAKPKGHQRHPKNLRTEQRILERLNKEKFVLRVELYKWLPSLEKDKSSKVDRYTIDRILDRLKQEVPCKCRVDSVPYVTKSGCNRICVIVLHPSVQTQDVLGEIHERIKSFEIELRGQDLPKKKSDETIPILNGVRRSQTNVDLDARTSKSRAMQASGVVLAKMVCVKLLHCFLWEYISSLPGWDSGFSSKNDQKFSLKDAFRAMPLKLFLQVVGSTQKADDMTKKCEQVMRLSELPSEEYKLLMDTRAIGRLSMLIDILCRLKLFQMVNNRLRRDEIEEKYANLTHAMELKTYIEEPVFVAATKNATPLDIPPRIRHEFTLSNRDAVDEYWLTLEYYYAAADHKAAKQAFPGSVVQEVFRPSSWASDHVMTSEQRAKLLQHIAIDEKEILSFKGCKKIAKDLNLTLEQVMYVYHAEHGSRVNSKSEDNNAVENSPSASRKRKRRVKSKSEDNHAVENSPSVSRKRKRATSLKTKGKAVKSIIVDEQRVINSDAKDASNSEIFQKSLQEDQTPIPIHQGHNQQENAEKRDPSENEGQGAYQLASSRTVSAPSRRFLWTDEADRQLLSQYVRHRASLGANLPVNWASIPDLPAPPVSSMRRIHRLKKNDKFRKELMSLCNLLANRYAKHLESKQKYLPKSNSSHVLGRMESDCVEQGKDTKFDEEWDDFSEESISKAFNKVLELKKMAKLVDSKRTRPDSREWSNRDIVDEASKKAPPAVHSEDIQNVSVDQVQVQLRKSLAVSTAVELLKLFFLSRPTGPGQPNLIEETLRRYSEQDLFTAYSYLRNKKFLVGGSDGQPFVLSQNFLHSISKSPFPVDTGTRAAKFSSWLLEHERDLMSGGLPLTSDLQCGDVLNLLSSVASGELSLSVSLPKEGVGEPEDQRDLKRRADDIEESEPDNAKKLKLLREAEIDFRKEKGFPGIAVSVRRVTLPTAKALEFLEDDDSRTSELCLQSREANSGCDLDDMKKVFNSTDATVISGGLGDSHWQAMASFASCIMSKSEDEEVSVFCPEVFEAVSSALQKAGDQGLSIEDVHRLIDIPSRETRDCIVDVLQTFGVALQVNGYNYFRVVHSSYRSKYFLTLEEGGTSKKGEQTLPVDYLERALREHRSKDDVASGCSSSQDKREHVAANSVHKTTDPDLPEMAQISSLQEASLESETKESTSEKSPVPIFPWVNADGSINKIVFDGLVRRVLGAVMQNPGIPEDDIINLMDVLNPQSCRKLLEVMILDGYMKVREMVQTKCTGPPSLLTGSRKPELISRRHLFANSKGLCAL